MKTFKLKNRDLAHALGAVPGGMPFRLFEVLIGNNTKALSLSQPHSFPAPSTPIEPDHTGVSFTNDTPYFMKPGTVLVQAANIAGAGHSAFDVARAIQKHQIDGTVVAAGLDHYPDLAPVEWMLALLPQEELGKFNNAMRDVHGPKPVIRAYGQFVDVSKQLISPDAPKAPVTTKLEHATLEVRPTPGAGTISKLYRAEAESAAEIIAISGADGVGTPTKALVEVVGTSAQIDMFKALIEESIKHPGPRHAAAGSSNHEHGLDAGHIFVSAETRPRDVRHLADIISSRGLSFNTVNMARVLDSHRRTFARCEGVVDAGDNQNLVALCRDIEEHGIKRGIPISARRINPGNGDIAASMQVAPILPPPSAVSVGVLRLVNPDQAADPNIERRRRAA